MAVAGGLVLLAELKSYVGFGASDAALLAEAGPLISPAYPRVVDKFYEAIEAHPRARAVFADGAQIERQKKMLGGWLVGLFGGEYEAAYYETRARIGQVHVRIGLDPAFMVSAMSVVRTALHDAVADYVRGDAWSRDRRHALHRAVERICDIDLAIMLETYRDDFAVRIRSAEKLAALGEIAGTIGHEIRNPLAVMETSLHLLAPRIGDDPKAQRHLQRLSAQVALCSAIVRELMDIARDAPPNRVPTRLLEMAEEALRDLPGAQGVRVSVEPEDDLVCNVDPLQLRQLLVNLVTNALQAAKSGAAGVTVTLAHDPKQLTVIVEDDGEGIPEEVRARLFEPLFTTRMRGVGLGLALCRRIAERHGGQVRAMNRPQGGARFEVLLPCESRPVT